MPSFYQGTGKNVVLRSTANAVIDPEALPDPGDVVGLEANKLSAAPPPIHASWSRGQFHLCRWGTQVRMGKRCADFRSGILTTRKTHGSRYEGLLERWGDTNTI